MKALKIIALNPEPEQTKMGTLRTLTYQARAVDSDNNDSCVYELWFEYPSHTEEKPGGLDDGVVVYIMGQFVSMGDKDDQLLRAYIHVDEFVFNKVDFDELLTREMADVVTLSTQIDRVDKKDTTYKPKNGLPWGERKKQAETKKEEPQPEPEPEPEPPSEESEADSVGCNSPVPENADTSFDPEKIEEEAKQEEASTDKPTIHPQSWDGEDSGQAQANG